jgi:hypothetical protein
MSDIRRVGGVDLGMAWGTTGSAVLEFDAKPPSKWVSCRPGAAAWPRVAATAPVMADAIDAWAREIGLHAVSIDGPQAWRDPGRPPPGVGRRCEYEARTPGRTGAFGVSYPRTMLGWIRLSIEVFERLRGRTHVHVVNDAGARSLPPLPAGNYYLLECFPTSTWRTSGLKPLPGHVKAPPPVVEHFAADLWARFGLPAWASLDLQAVVAALPAAGLLGGPSVPVPRGEAARPTAASGTVPAHVIEGLIWDGSPRDPAAAPVTPSRERAAPPATTPAEAFNLHRDHDVPIVPDDRHPAADAIIQRGVELFRKLAAEANVRRPTGVGYAQFVSKLYGEPFAEVMGRRYVPSDSELVIRLAVEVTEANLGRIPVTRGGVTIQAGMDTFIWNAKPPHDRPPEAWQSRWSLPPYGPEDWRAIFPHGERRLLP